MSGVTSVKRDLDQEAFIQNLYKANNILGISLLVASITALLLVMTIYSYFVALQSVRVTLIKNITMAILFQEHVTLVLQTLVYFSRNENLPDIRCFFRNTSLCEALIAGSKYFELTTLSWLAVISFNQWCRSNPTLNNKFNFTIFSIIGWFSPIIPVAIWTGLMMKKNITKCWSGFNVMPEISVLEVSKLALILISVTLLVLTYANLYYSREIISVDEVLRQRGETYMLALVLIWFALGHVVYASCTHANYDNDVRAMTAWTYILTVLMSSGGLVAATCFCFLERNVRDTLTTTKK